MTVKGKKVRAKRRLQQEAEGKERNAWKRYLKSEAFTRTEWRTRASRLSQILEGGPIPLLILASKYESLHGGKERVPRHYYCRFIDAVKLGLFPGITCEHDGKLVVVVGSAECMGTGLYDGAPSAVGPSEDAFISGAESSVR